MEEWEAQRAFLNKHLGDSPRKERSMELDDLGAGLDKRDPTKRWMDTTWTEFQI
jgi:hypothetical protein